MKTTEKITLSYEQQHILGKIVDFMIRGKPIKVRYIKESEIAFIVPFHYSDEIQKADLFNRTERWVYINIAMLIFYIMPQFFDLGPVNIDLKDIDSILDLYNKQCDSRLATEETTEKAGTVDLNEEDYYLIGTAGI